MDRTRRMHSGDFIFLVLTGLWAFAILGPGRAGAQQAGFVEVNPLPEGRQMHSAAALGDYLYVFGGAKAAVGWTQSVQVAPVYADGTLGAWLETTPLPENRHYIANGTIALNDVVYIAGGAVGETGHANTVLWTRPIPGGNLEPWRQSTPFTRDRLSFITVVSTPGRLHLLGGLSEDGQPTNYVIQGTIASDGSLTEWTPGPPLPKPLWWHQAAASGGRVWVWAGLPTGEYTPISTSVYSAPILGTGELGAWRDEPNPLPVPIFGATTATAGSYLLSFCPRISQDQSTNDVWFNFVSNDSLGPWQRISTQLPNRIYFAVATDYRRDTVYVIGGKSQRGAGDPNGRVFFFRLAAEAPTEVAQAAPTATRPPAARATAPPTAAQPAAPYYPPAPAQPAPGVAAQPAQTAPQFSYQAQAQLAQGAVPGFYSFNQAREIASTPPRRPLVLYFHNNVSSACRQQVQTLLNDPRWPELSRQAVFAWIDVEQSPQIAQQLGIYKVPSWALYDTQGNPLGQNYGILSVDQIAAAVARVTGSAR